MGKKITYSSKVNSDKELKLKEQNIEILKAIANMLVEEDAIANGKKPSASFNEIFGIDN